MTANPWLRPDDIINAVSDWTGISKKDLTAGGRPTNRAYKARSLLALALVVGLELSHRETATVMGYRMHRTGSVITQLIRKADPSEVAAVVNLAKDRRHP